jgi:hypothetical protein
MDLADGSASSGHDSRLGTREAGTHLVVLLRRGRESVAKYSGIELLRRKEPAPPTESGPVATAMLARCRKVLALKRAMANGSTGS